MSDAVPTGWRLYTHPRVLALLALGFSSGLPFLLVSSTLAFWLKDASVALVAIGTFAGIRVIYSIKFLWAPLVNQAPLPLLTRRLGQRRSWLLLGQAVVMAGLAWMSLIDVGTQLGLLAAVAMVTTLGSATLDMALDAYRIESAGQELQPAMLAAYTLGYRLAVLVTGAGALALAQPLGWAGVYQLMALLGVLGIITTLIVAEPAPRPVPATAGDLRAWLIDAVVAPFREFFSRYTAGDALWLLVFIALYRLSDFSLGNMTSTLYKDLGFTNAEIGMIVKFAGFFATIAGAGLAGWLGPRWRIDQALLAGAALMACTNASFAFLATRGHDLAALTLVVSTENFAQGFASIAFVAFLSALCNRRYTATQYALFYSLASLLGHTAASFGGAWVGQIGYPGFFAGTGLAGLPAIAMTLYLRRRQLLRGSAA